MKEVFNIKEAHIDLKEVKQVMESCGVRFFIGYGACLGFIRDGNFIKHDDDIDLCVVDDISYEKRKEIGWKLLDIGFKPQPIYFNVLGRMELSEPGYNGDEHTGVIVCEKRVHITIFFFREEDCPTHGKEMVCIPKYGGYKLISTPSKFYEKGETLKIKGEKYLIPSPVKEYLNFTYGNWKKKIEGKHALQYREYHNNML